MWINKKRRRAYWLSPSFSPPLSIRSLWNAMQWNGMKWNEESFAPWTIKSFHAPLNYLCGPEKRRTRLTSSSSPFSRRISGMLCSMCRPERNWLPLEKCARKCRKSKSKRPRNPAASLSHRSNSLPPFFTDEGTLATDTNWFQWNFSKL